MYSVCLFKFHVSGGGCNYIGMYVCMNSILLNQLVNIAKSFLRDASIFQANEMMNAAAFSAYRDLIRCSVPKERLLWLRMGYYTYIQYIHAYIQFILQKNFHCPL